MKSVKTDDWTTALDSEVERHQKLSFEYGVNDCVSFAADCVKAYTGVDFLEKYRGRYSNETEAQGYVDDLGGLEKALETLLNSFAPINCPKGLMKRGDVALIEISGKLLCGVVMGSFALAPFPDKGLCKVPAANIKRVWGIT